MEDHFSCAAFCLKGGVLQRFRVYELKKNFWGQAPRPSFSLNTISFSFHLLKGFCTSFVPKTLQFYCFYQFVFTSFLFGRVFQRLSLSAFFVNFDDHILRAMFATFPPLIHVNYTHLTSAMLGITMLRGASSEVHLGKFICGTCPDILGTNVSNIQLRTHLWYHALHHAHIVFPFTKVRLLRTASTRDNQGNRRDCLSSFLQ